MVVLWCSKVHSGIQAMVTPRHSSSPHFSRLWQHAKVVDVWLLVHHRLGAHRQPRPHILLIPGVYGPKGRLGVAQVHGYSHEDILHARVWDVAVVCCLCPADDGETSHRGVRVAIGSKLYVGIQSTCTLLVNRQSTHFS